MRQNAQFKILPFYRLILDDYAKPSFCSWDKSYFGSLKHIENLIHAVEADERINESFSQLVQAFKEYISGNTKVKHNVAFRDIPLLEPVSIYAKASSFKEFNKLEHLNVWNCIYYMRWDKAENDHIWIGYESGYARCIKTLFYGLEYADADAEESYRPIKYCLGFPKQIELRDSLITNRLYVTEKIFENEKELLDDIRNFKCAPDPVYTEIFNDIFGDG